MSLKWKLILRIVAGLIVFIALVFIPAGTLKFWQGWTFLAILFVQAIAGLAYFYVRDPQFVARRTQMKEKVPEQRTIMTFVYMVFFAAFVLPGFDHRFGWSHSPLWLTIAAQTGVFFSYMLVVRAMSVNRFAGRTIQVESGQQVISTGPYAVVRHPMYSGMCVMVLFLPLALGSYVTLPAFMPLIPLFVLRLLNEEKILRQELSGYTEYCLQTRFRLVPFVW